MEPGAPTQTSLGSGQCGGAEIRDHTERLARILDNLAEHIRTVPGEELLEAAREEGRDTAEVTARITGLLRSTFKTYQQKALLEAQEGYQREIASLSERRFNLPKTAVLRRFASRIDRSDAEPLASYAAANKQRLWYSWQYCQRDRSR